MDLLLLVPHTLPCHCHLPPWHAFFCRSLNRTCLCCLTVGWMVLPTSIVHAFCHVCLFPAVVYIYTNIQLKEKITHVHIPTALCSRLWTSSSGYVLLVVHGLSSPHTHTHAHRLFSDVHCCSGNYLSHMGLPPLLGYSLILKTILCGTGWSLGLHTCCSHLPERAFEGCRPRWTTGTLATSLGCRHAGLAPRRAARLRICWQTRTLVGYRLVPSFHLDDGGHCACRGSGTVGPYCLYYTFFCHLLLHHIPAHSPFFLCADNM